MFSITITYPTTEDAILALSALRAYEASAGTAKPARQPKATAADTKPTAAPSPAPAEPPAAAPATKAADSEKAKPAADTPDYDTVVGPAISEAVKVNRAALIGVLTKYDAKTGKQLKPEQYVAFMADLEKALAGDGDDLA